MSDAPLIMMTDPAHYDVSYVINPWMRPDAWQAEPERHRSRALAAHAALRERLEELGATVRTIPGVDGLPDMVFPANAAVVLDRRVLLARFASGQRAAEAARFGAAFDAMVTEGLLDSVSVMPDGALHEGAGDAIWDRTRGLFWAGHGQRSNRAGVEAVAACFNKPMATLELATPRFYHLDTCFCPLGGGEVLFYPPAFTPDALDTIHAHVAPDQRIVATDEDAARFCVNAVNIGSSVVMASATPALRGRLEARGYQVSEVDLTPFMMSGGASYCMTLRLDRSSTHG